MRFVVTTPYRINCFGFVVLTIISNFLGTVVTMAESSGSNTAAPKKKHQDVETQNLEKVTDYVEETESEELGKAMTLLESDMQKKNETKAKRDQELAKVVISKADVELIIQELDLPRITAERRLREHGGDLIKTLHTLTN